MSTPLQSAIPLAANACVSIVVELAGATNLGTALGIGQVALVYVLLSG